MLYCHYGHRPETETRRLSLFPSSPPPLPILLLQLGDTALHGAAWKGNAEVVAMLLEKGTL